MARFPVQFSAALVLMMGCTVAFDKDDFVFGDTGVQLDAGPDGMCECAPPGQNVAELGCDGDRCIIAACADGFENCDDNLTTGCERGIASDVENCGGCGTVCDEVANSTTTCDSGICNVACTEGFAECDDIAGCEPINTVTHCGSCDNTCGASMVCSLGSCADNCAGGEMNCGGTCISVAAAEDHCGACDVMCPEVEHATRICVASECGGACDVGYGNCDEVGAGCETNLNTDALHCGRCNMPCPVGHNVAAASCAAGTCGIATCETGFLDCDGNLTNGCERPVSDDPSNCGGCDRVCNLDHTETNGCNSGLCTVDSCQTHYGDCNLNDTDGCEIDFLTDTDNCGGCGAVCAGTCSGGECSTGVVEVAIEANSICALLRNGRVYCAGENFYGEVGIEGKLPVGPLTPIDSADLFVSLAAGSNHTCAVRDDGDLFCWGRGNVLQLGTSVPGVSTSPQRVMSALAGFTAETFTDVVAGQNHSCALSASGQVWCWGWNTSSQTDGTAPTGPNALLATPISFPVGRTATAIDVGRAHSCALLDDSEVWCWGRDDQGQLGRGPASPATGGAEAVPSLTNVVQLSVGGSSNCAINTSRELYCWGSRSDGQIRGDGTVYQVAGNFDEVRVGFTTVFARTGSSWRVWGRNDHGQFGNGEIDATPLLDTGTATSPMLPAGTEQVISGVLDSCAIASGRLYCWGRNEFAATGRAEVYQTSPSPMLDTTGAPLANVLQASASAYGGCVRHLIGGVQSVSCWGLAVEVNGFGQPSWSRKFGSPSPVVTDYAPSAGISFVEAGNDNGCLIDDGEVYCWGQNLGYNPTHADPIGLFGRPLGGGPSTPTYASPTRFHYGGDWTTLDEISLGHGFACGRRGSEIKCWGRTSRGQCGQVATGTVAPDATVLQMPGGGPISATTIETGEYGGCAIETDGGLLCWGFGYAGDGTGEGNSLISRVSNPTGSEVLMGVSDVSVGHLLICAVADPTNTVYCWGRNASDQLGTPGPIAQTRPVATSITNAAQVVVGNAFACARLNDGTVQCWGDNHLGQLGRGDRNDASAPAVVPGLTDVQDLSTGHRTANDRYTQNHICARLGSGRVQCWGSSLAGRTSNGEPTIYTEPGRVRGLP